MDHETEVIKGQMEDTRASLSEKLETLEQTVAGVVDTVQGATASVSDTMQSVKQSVEDTVESVKDSLESTVENVKETFDLRLQMERHPWMMLGGSLALGFVAGKALAASRHAPRRRPPASAPMHTPYPQTPLAATSLAAPNGGMRETGAVAKTEEPESSWLNALGETFGNELSKLKGLAIGAALGVVRDMVVQTATPQLSAQLADIVNGITAKLGGEVIPGPILPPREEPASAEQQSQGDVPASTRPATGSRRQTPASAGPQRR